MNVIVITNNDTVVSIYVHARHTPHEQLMTKIARMKHQVSATMILCLSPEILIFIFASVSTINLQLSIYNLQQRIAWLQYNCLHL